MYHVRGFIKMAMGHVDCFQPLNVLRQQIGGAGFWVLSIQSLLISSFFIAWRELRPGVRFHSTRLSSKFSFACRKSCFSTRWEGYYMGRVLLRAGEPDPAMRQDVFALLQVIYHSSPVTSTSSGLKSISISFSSPTYGVEDCSDGRKRFRCFRRPAPRFPAYW
jgi:hypothetical protein